MDHSVNQCPTPASENFANVLQSAYRAYTTLWELPHDAPAFDVDAAGNPIVEQRELLCGFGGPLNGNCGKKFLAKQKLKRHLQKDHDVHPVDRYQVQDRPTSDKMAHSKMPIVYEFSSASDIA